MLGTVWQQLRKICVNFFLNQTLHISSLSLLQSGMCSSLRHISFNFWLKGGSRSKSLKSRKCIQQRKGWRRPFRQNNDYLFYSNLAPALKLPRHVNACFFIFKWSLLAAFLVLNLWRSQIVGRGDLFFCINC